MPKCPKWSLPLGFMNNILYLCPAQIILPDFVNLVIQYIVDSKNCEVLILQISSFLRLHYASFLCPEYSLQRPVLKHLCFLLLRRESKFRIHMKQLVNGLYFRKYC
jgi:hypothetical protein